MCGIIASISKKPSLSNIDRIKLQYEFQKNRGTNGFGFVAVKDGEVVLSRARTEEAILKELDKMGETTLIMFHHRIPTCNLNVVEANHPVFVANKANLKNKYFLIHNGHISNTDELRKKHEAEGFKYRTEVAWKYGKTGIHTYREHTDTESMAIETALFVEGKKNEIGAQGGAAIFMLEIDKNNNPVNFYYFRSGNPIKWHVNQENLFLASEATGLTLEENTMFRLSLDSFVLEEKFAQLEKSGVVTMMPRKNHWKAVTAKKTPVVAIPTPVRHTQLVETRKEGNTLIISPLKNELGFRALHGHPSPLSSSLRTHVSLKNELEQAQEKLYSAQADVAGFEETFPDVDSEYHNELLKEEEKHRKRVEILKDQIESGIMVGTS